MGISGWWKVAAPNKEAAGRGSDLAVAISYTIGLPEYVAGVTILSNDCVTHP
jgi:hypothetical protein